MRIFIMLICLLYGSIQAAESDIPSPYYSMGFNMGQKTASEAWKTFGSDCNNLNLYIIPLENSINRVFSTKTEGAADFQRGYAAAMSVAMKEGAAKCDIEIPVVAAVTKKLVTTATESPIHMLGRDIGYLRVKAQWFISGRNCKNIEALKSFSDNMQTTEQESNPHNPLEYLDGIKVGMLEGYDRAYKICTEPVTNKSPSSALVPTSTNKQTCSDEGQPSLFYVSCNLGNKLIISAWSDLSKDPNGAVKLPTMLERILEQQVVKVAKFDVVQFDGFVAGVKNALTKIEVDCRCNLAKSRQIVDGWVKKTDYPVEDRSNEPSNAQPIPRRHWWWWGG